MGKLFTVPQIEIHKQKIRFNFNPPHASNRERSCSNEEDLPGVSLTGGDTEHRAEFFYSIAFERADDAFGKLITTDYNFAHNTFR